MIRPRRAVAAFDSASAMLRALAATLRDRDLPLLGQVPRGLAPVVEPLLGGVNHLPSALRERLYSWSGWAEAVPARRLGDVDTDQLARWVVDHYPQRSYPAVLIGSSNGALVHLAAALGIPWLPQTLLIPVRRGEMHPDEPAAEMEAMAPAADALLGANPNVALHHMHDANQDRLMIRRMSYFRLKWLQLPAAYRQFIRAVLPAGQPLIVVDCGLRWPTTRLGPRHVFQHGALGGASVDEYQQGSDRIEAFLRRRGSSHRRWRPPPTDGDSAEAEWGFAGELTVDLRAFASQAGYRVRRLSFSHPEHLSAPVADLYRGWHRRRGVDTNRLLIETFVLIEPWWTLRTASVPLWLAFNVEPSVRAAETYLDSHDAFDEIRLTLFSHGIDSVGLGTADQWRRVLARARKIGVFAGADPNAYPRDFASLARTHRALAGIRHVEAMPSPISLDDVEYCLRLRQGHDQVSLDDMPLTNDV